MYKELNELLSNKKDIEIQIESEKIKIINEALEAKGLKIGDKVSLKDGTLGVIRCVEIKNKSYLTNGEYMMKVECYAVKKDGDASKNSWNKWNVTLDDVEKV